MTLLHECADVPQMLNCIEAVTWHCTFCLFKGEVSYFKKGRNCEHLAEAARGVEAILNKTLLKITCILPFGFCTFAQM